LGVLLTLSTACEGIGLDSVMGGARVEAADAGRSADSAPDSRPAAEGAEAEPSADAAIFESAATGDAGAAGPPVLGSRLCNVMASTCKPDEQACVYAFDGGTKCAFGADCEDAGIVAAACRVVDFSPVCSTEIGLGKEGSSCSQSSDCEAELECVGGWSSTSSSKGTCKHYCCDSSTVCATASNDASPQKGIQAFCDLEPVFDAKPSSQLVPVCTSGAACLLLGTDCSSGKSCTVVDPTTGQTACVTPGSAKLGEDCTIQKCASDLACIGGTCRQLCSTLSPSCMNDSSCTALSALGSGFGICD
jgi:hypothetical protein